MDRLQRILFLAELIDQLARSGSWCGEALVQRVVYLLQGMLGVPTGFLYILYKGNPHSFDLASELAEMRADSLIRFDRRSRVASPAFVATASSIDLRSRYPKTLARYRCSIAFAVRVFGGRTPAELEKLAAAQYVTRELGSKADVPSRVRRLLEVKPGIEWQEAEAAILECERLAGKAKKLGCGVGVAES